jgi:hypothetical protein
MKRSGSILPLLLVLGLVFAAAAPGGLPGPGAGEPVSLIRIAKGPSSIVRVLVRLQIDVRQELDTCFLALAEPGDLRLLRRSGIRFTILDRAAARRQYLVVGTGRPGDLASLRSAGRAAAVEPEAAVFWTEEGSPVDQVPFGLPRKVLAPRSVLPYIRSRPEQALPAAAALTQDPFVESIVSLVSTPELAARVQILQDFQTRYAMTTNCAAAGEALFSSFTALGLDEVRFEPFTFSGSSLSRNVIAEKTGERYPDDIYVICAHYDSISSTPLTLAPGADDNASGTAAVLEAARVLAPYPLDYTVRFIAFSAEELGLWGSRAHAAAARAAGDRILGVINLDMIAYADILPEELEIVVNGDSGWIGDLFVSACSRYGQVEGRKTVDPSLVYSDHSPFWDNGYPALLAIEDYPLANPYYHRTTDTLSTLELDFFTDCTRAAVGLLAELAQPIKEGHPRTPVGLTAETTVYSSLFNALKSVRLDWTVQADAAGYNIYRTTTPHGGYIKINTTPVSGASFVDENVGTGLTFFYAVTAVGPTGLESNRSRDALASFVTVRPPASVLSVTPPASRGLR